MLRSRDRETPPLLRSSVLTVLSSFRYSRKTRPFGAQTIGAASRFISLRTVTIPEQFAGGASEVAGFLSVASASHQINRKFTFF